ncbi:hypothetical protein DSO57_1013796 [Entomophthora muscae]|uniref:Uncharacterized protein n=1 Tax=Entomophthora muscae TaxID=34485 RepID=A0ACC2RWS6_9FUNG|nr:hypothetical protein DSO57_1013796 [Entomophthora muscae]
MKSFYALTGGLRKKQAFNIPSSIMVEDTFSNARSLQQQCYLAEQRVDQLTLAYQRLEFDKDNQIEDLKSKLAKAYQDLNQLFGQYQANGLKNAHIKDQLRYASAYQSDLSQSAAHYFEKANKLEFTVDYKNFLLGNQQDLLEHDANRRADEEFFKSNSDAGRAPLSQQFFASVLSEIVDEPKVYAQKVSPAPSRTHSFGRCQREAGKASRILSNHRLMRKNAANKLVAATRRK